MPHKKFLALEILFLLIAGTMIGLLQTDPKSNQVTHPSLLFPPKDLKYFTLGYQEVFADVLWIRSLQDIDLCGKGAEVRAAEVKPMPKKTLYDSIQASEPIPADQFNITRCQDGWSARMMDAVTELAPRFKMPYLVGGTILSVVVHDNIGAAKIFKKGVERFPEDWTMSYRAAYHFLAGLADYKTASELLIQSGKHGAPKWVFGLAARLQTRTGQAILAKPVLEEAIAADPDSDWAGHLKDRLKEVNEIIEKGE